MDDGGARERMVLVKWSPALAAGVLGFTALLWLVPLAAVLGSDEPSTGGWIAAAVLALPFAWVCWRAPKALRGMGIEFDAEGIHPFDGWRTGTIAWPDVAAVGFGSYASRHRRLPRATVAALEVYLTATSTPDAHPRLRNDWQPVAPPAPGLSAGCFRYTVSPYGAHAAAVERAVRRFRPGAWSGPFEHVR